MVNQMSAGVSLLIFCALCLTLFTILGFKAYKDMLAEDKKIHELAQNSNLKPIDD